MALPSNVLAQALQMSQGQALKGPATAPASPKRMDDPDFLAALLSTFDDENSLLAQQLKRAQEAQQAGPRYSTPLATAIGGLGGFLRNVKGATDESNITSQMQGVQERRAEAVQKAGQGPSAALLRAQAAEAAKPKLSSDPNSPESRRAQANFAALQPGRFTPEQLSQFSEADIIDRFQLPKYGSMATSQEIQREGIEAANRRNADRLGQTRELFYQRLGLDREKMGQDDRQFYDDLSDKATARAEGRADRAEERTEKGALELSKRLENMPGIANDLVTLSKYASAPDVPGVGATGAVPSGLLSPEGVQVRQSVRGVVGTLLKEQSGGAVLEAELDRKLEELGMGKTATDREFRIGLRRLLENTDAVMRSKEAGASPEAVERYRKRGGTTAEDLPSGALRRKTQPKPPAAAAPGLPPGKARVRLKAGGTLLIDAADLAEALRDPEVAGEVK